MSLDAFLQVPFDYVVYDDSYGRAHFSNFKTVMSAQIKEITEATGGVYKRVPQKFHEDRRCLFLIRSRQFSTRIPIRAVVISTNLYSAIRMCTAVRPW